jgi:hypothetical protein
MLPVKFDRCIPVGNISLLLIRRLCLFLVAPLHEAATLTVMRWTFFRMIALGCTVTAVSTAPGETGLLDGSSLSLSGAEPLARRSVMVGDHRMTLVRIRAPRLTPVLLAPVMAEAPSEEALATEARREAKASAFVSLSVTVYPGPITEIVWKYQDRSFRAYSNVDFRHLGWVSEIETDTAVLSWFFIPMEGEADGLATQLRAELGLSTAFAEYVVDATDEEMAATPEAFAVLDAIPISMPTALNCWRATGRGRRRRRHGWRRRWPTRNHRRTRPPTSGG